MKKVTRLLPLLTIGAWLWAVPVNSVAQDYDDDLYYSPKKAQEKKAQQKAQEAARQAQQFRADWTTVEYPASDAYTSGSTMPLKVDVDTYNRRGDYNAASNPDSAAAMQEDFSYTRRLERYHNPDVVVKSGDDELIEYYYSNSSASRPEVNVYVINDLDPWYSWSYNPWRYSYYRPYWSWSWNLGWRYDPWFDVSFGWGRPWYGPSWGWNWGWGPSWGWNPGPGWGHGPIGPGWGGPRPPHHNVAVNRPGTMRPHGPSYGNGAVSRPTRPTSAVAGNHSSSARPSSSRWDYDRPGNVHRPSSASGSNNHSGSSVNRPSAGNQHQASPSQSVGSQNKTNNAHRSYRNSGSNSSGSNNSYRSSGNSSNRSSSPSYNSGSSRGSGSSYGGGHSTGGGRSTGGGGSRGRR